MATYFSPPNVISFPAVVENPQGRLTLTTAVPVLTGAVATSATVLYTPYVGNLIPIWNGSAFQVRTFTELTNTLANSATGNAGPAPGAASKNYDLFVWDNGGTLTLTRGAVWNSDTVRSSATENDLQRVQGKLVNLNAITNGPAVGYGLYVGTVRTDAGGATVSWALGGSGAGGTPATINVWNMYNRAQVNCQVMDSNAAWSYATATPRSADNSTGNRISMVRGLNEDGVEANYSCRLTTAAVLNALGLISIGLDVTNSLVNGGTAGLYISPIAAGESGQMFSRYIGANPGLGFHFLQAIEQGDGNANSFGGVTGGIQYMALTATMQA